MSVSCVWWKRYSMRSPVEMHNIYHVPKIWADKILRWKTLLKEDGEGVEEWVGADLIGRSMYGANFGLLSPPAQEVILREFCANFSLEENLLISGVIRQNMSTKGLRDYRHFPTIKRVLKIIYICHPLSLSQYSPII